MFLIVNVLIEYFSSVYSRRIFLNVLLNQSMKAVFFRIYVVSNVCRIFVSNRSLFRLRFLF